METPGRTSGRRRALWVLLPLVAVAGLLGAAIAFVGPLLRPLAEARASAMLGRPVAIGRLRIRPGTVVTIAAEDLTLGNPADFPPEAPPFARIGRLAVDLALGPLLREGTFVLPRVALERPEVEVLSLPDGRVNHGIALPEGPAGEGDADATSRVRIGALEVREARAHVALAGLAADFEVRAATEEGPDGRQRIRAEAEGTYARQPITARLEGGAVLDLREAGQPWPVRLEVANGPTRAVLQGTLRDPLSFAGADLRLEAEGPDMALLAPLSGVPFPPTPPFRLGGRLDYVAEGRRLRFQDAEGAMGRTDVSGALIATLTRAPRPVVAAEVRSRRVDLADLAGFFGAQPGRATTPGLTEPQRDAVAQRQRAPRLIPDAPLDLPRMRAVDLHVDYHADRIEGRGMPFDALSAQFDVEDGAVTVRRLVLPVGDGEVVTRFALTPQADGRTLEAEGEVELQRVDFARLMGAAGVQGSGRLGGVGRFEGQGRSLAEIAASAEGEATLAMVGGTLRAVLVDLSGLRFGKALLSALGLPEREAIECLVADFPLRRGTLTARTMVMETESAVVTGSGRIALAEERLDLRIKTDSKRPTIGSLPTPILVRGTLKEPSVGLEPAEAAARAGAAAGLAAILPPLAVLPTLQLGVGEGTTCDRLRARMRGRGAR